MNMAKQASRYFDARSQERKDTVTPLLKNKTQPRLEPSFIKSIYTTKKSASKTVNNRSIASPVQTHIHLKSAMKKTNNSSIYNMTAKLPMRGNHLHLTHLETKQIPLTLAKSLNNLSFKSAEKTTYYGDSQPTQMTTYKGPQQTRNRAIERGGKQAKVAVYSKDRALVTK